MSEQNTPASTSPMKRKLRLWEVTALSVGFMGPVMAVALNGIGVAGLVGKAVPLTFLVAFIGTLFVGYAFIRLTGKFSHAGSVYALAGRTIGPKAGFFGGFALLGTYLFFAACILGAAGVFFDGFMQLIVPGFEFNLEIVVIVVVSVLVLLLCLRESRVVTQLLTLVGAVGILAMLILAVVVLWKVQQGTGPVENVSFDFSTFMPENLDLVGILTGSVFAFLSWAGFESGTSLSEETENPKRTIPRALFGAITLAGLLYVLMMYVQTVGFGADDAGIQQFATSSSALNELSAMYIGKGFAILIALIAFIVAMGAATSSTMAAARLIYALARDGFGPASLGTLNPKTSVPTRAVIWTCIIAFVLAVIVFLTGHSSLEIYFWYAFIATLCMIVAYAVTSIGAIKFILSNKDLPRWELIFPVLGLLYLFIVFLVQIIGQEAPYAYLAYLAGLWCIAGAIIIICLPGLVKKIGANLTEEV